MRRIHFVTTVFILCAVACLHPAIPSAAALLGGAAFGLSVGNPLHDRSRRWTPRLLAWSIIAIGAGMNLEIVARVGLHGFVYTAVGILLTLGAGQLLARTFNVERNISILLSVGTAICGGSAIAAVAPVIRAKPHEVSVALAVVFLLNAAALVLFPWAGHLLHLDPTQFGLWSALAIHDTSSVVGASMQFGARALEVGTTVKLARALWIIPVAFLFSLIRSQAPDSGEASTKPKRPWFILGFLLAAALVTWVPALATPGDLMAQTGRRLLVLTLFLIGAGLSRRSLAEVGFRPLLQALVIWIAVAAGTLMGIRSGWINL